MKKLICCSLLFLSIFCDKKTEEPISCPHEPEKEQAITCCCKGKINGSVKIKPTKRNHSYAGKEPDYCGVKCSKEIKQICQEDCTPHRGVSKITVYEQKKNKRKK